MPVTRHPPHRSVQALLTHPVLILNILTPSVPPDADAGSRLPEIICFGGLSVAETADVLQVAPETVMRDWRMAKAWLFRELASK